MRPSSIVVLTGAGISAESGLHTFRDKDGIWSRIDYRDVATPEGFRRDPVRVHEFYNWRRANLCTVEPNAAHVAVARLERETDAKFLLVTQNIDDLHERAGSRNAVHMHGELKKILCARCGMRMEWQGDLSTDMRCLSCHSAKALRPDVVWFGEMPYHMDEIHAALSSCDLFVSIGTSGNVYPAAGFVEDAREAGAYTVELNLEPSEGVSFFHEAIRGKATEIVPAFIETLLSR